jgi:hypothetical protein
MFFFIKIRNSLVGLHVVVVVDLFPFTFSLSFSRSFSLSFFLHQREICVSATIGNPTTTTEPSMFIVAALVHLSLFPRCTQLSPDFQIIH